MWLGARLVLPFRNLRQAYCFGDDESLHPRFGMAPQRMVGSYACSYVTYSDYHRPAHRLYFAAQLHDALTRW